MRYDRGCATGKTTPGTYAGPSRPSPQSTSNWRTPARVPYTPEHAVAASNLIRDYPHVYADLGALDPQSPALEALVEAAGPDRAMFGTDWPHFAQGEDMAARIASVRAPGRFSRETGARILGGNAVDFVKGRPPGLIPRQ